MSFIIKSIVNYKDYIQRDINKAKDKLSEVDFQSPRFFIIKSHIRDLESILHNKHLPKNLQGKVVDNVINSGSFDEWYNSN